MDEQITYPPQAIEEIERLQQEVSNLRFTYEQLGITHNKLSIEYDDFRKSASDTARDEFSKNWALKQEIIALKKKLLDNTIRHAEEVIMLKGEIDSLNQKVFEADYGIPF